MTINLSLKNQRHAQALLDAHGGNLDDVVNSCLGQYFKEHQQDIPDYGARATTASLMGDVTAKAIEPGKTVHRIEHDVPLR